MYWTHQTGHRPARPKHGLLPQLTAVIPGLTQDPLSGAAFASSGVLNGT